MADLDRGTLEETIEAVYKRLWAHKHSDATTEQQAGWDNALVAFKQHLLRALADSDIQGECGTEGGCCWKPFCTPLLD